MRRVGALVGAAVLTILLAGCWPVPGQNYNRTGYNALESAITPANVATLTQKWAYPATPTGWPARDPAVSPGGVHMSFSICAVVTVAAATGAVRWVREPILGACGIQPAEGGVATRDLWVDGDIVYVGWEAFESRGPTHPPGYGSGTDGWNVKTGSEAGHLSDGVLNARRDGTIGTTSGRMEDPESSESVTYTDNLRNLDGDAGFTFPGRTTEQATIGSLDAPVMFAAANGSVQAYDTGISGGGCGPGTSTACLRWEAPVDGRPSRPVLGGGGQTVFVATGGGTVYALDGSTGDVRWTGALGAPSAASPALADGVLYVPRAGGDLVAFAQDGCGGAPTCEPLWSASAGSNITKQPAVGGGVVFTGSADGSLHGFAADGCGTATTCPALWTATTNGSHISGGPVVSNGQVYAGTANGQMFAFGLP